MAHFLGSNTWRSSRLIPLWCFLQSYHSLNRCPLPIRQNLILGLISWSFKHLLILKFCLWTFCIVHTLKNAPYSHLTKTTFCTCTSRYATRVQLMDSPGKICTMCNCPYVYVHNNTYHNLQRNIEQCFLLFRRTFWLCRLARGKSKTAAKIICSNRPWWPVWSSLQWQWECRICRKSHPFLRCSRRWRRPIWFGVDLNLIIALVVLHWTYLQHHYFPRWRDKTSTYPYRNHRDSWYEWPLGFTK